MPLDRITLARFVLPGAVLRMQPFVLLVDADAEGSARVADAFRRDGFLVTSTGSAFGAVAVTKRVRPDLVVLDLALPYWSGASLLGRFQADPELAAVPVVVCSALADALPPQRRAAAAAVLAKPLDADLLLDVIHALLPPVSAARGRPAQAPPRRARGRARTRAA